MIQKEKDLCFFTTSYPYGTGESFIENELNFIAPYFKTVHLFHKHKEKETRKIPSNVIPYYIDVPNSANKKQVLKSNFFLFLYLLVHELIFSRQKKMFLKNFRYNLHYILGCIYYSEKIKERLNFETITNSFFYSYWFFDWNFSLSILKKKKLISNNVTRAHGFDLYENNGKENFLPHRKFCITHTDKVIAVSKLGENYLKKLYPKFNHKISYSYLGTKEYGTNPTSKDKKLIHIVSCSNVNEVKRLHLIVEVLKHITFPVKWTHIGKGNLLADVKEKTKELAANILLDFKGELTQSQIFDFYLTTPIDVFVNVSISEGLPVSMMEAISCGIPVIATDVGGTSEIINQETGILIDPNFEPKKVAERLINFSSSERHEKLRLSSKIYWKNNFCAETNYSNFIRELFC